MRFPRLKTPRQILVCSTKTPIFPTCVHRPLHRRNIDGTTNKCQPRLLRRTLHWWAHQRIRSRRVRTCRTKGHWRMCCKCYTMITGVLSFEPKVLLTHVQRSSPATIMFPGLCSQTRTFSAWLAPRRADLLLIIHLKRNSYQPG